MPKNRMRCAADESSTCLIFDPTFGISQLFIMRFTRGLVHCNGDLISFHVIYESNFSVKYL